MGGRNYGMYTNGTSALKMPRWAESPEDAKIIVFPGSRNTVREASVPAIIEQHSEQRAAESFKHRVLESSEMYCSLRYESMKGCPYNLFDEKAIAALSIGGAIIAAISLILGA